MDIANTPFKIHKKRRYTWTMPGDIGRCQLDYILVKQRFRNQVKDCKIKRSLKFKATKKVMRTDKFDTGKLQDKETRKPFQKAVKDELVTTRDSGRSDQLAPPQRNITIYFMPHFRANYGLISGGNADFWALVFFSKNQILGGDADCPVS